MALPTVTDPNLKYAQDLTGINGNFLAAWINTEGSGNTASSAPGNNPFALSLDWARISGYGDNVVGYLKQGGGITQDKNQAVQPGSNPIVAFDSPTSAIEAFASGLNGFSSMASVRAVRDSAKPSAVALAHAIQDSGYCGGCSGGMYAQQIVDEWHVLTGDLGFTNPFTGNPVAIIPGTHTPAPGSGGSTGGTPGPINPGGSTGGVGLGSTSDCKKPDNVLDVTGQLAYMQCTATKSLAAWWSATLKSFEQGSIRVGGYVIGALLIIVGIYIFIGGEKAQIVEKAAQNFGDNQE